VNILFLGARDLRQNYNSDSIIGATNFINWLEGEWTTLIDTVVCEEKLENVDWIVHTGISNYNYTQQTYEGLLPSLQAVVDHCIHREIPLIYISDIQAKNKSPRDESYEYLHHLAEREIQRGVNEGTRAWIIRPSFILEEIMRSEFGSHITKMISPYVVSENDIISMINQILNTQPMTKKYQLIGNKVSISLFYDHLDYGGLACNGLRKIFSKSVEWVNYKAYQGPFPDTVDEDIVDFNYMRPEKVIESFLSDIDEE